MEIIVNDAIAQVPRTLKERLFTLPWKPWKRTRSELLCSDGIIYKIGGTRFMMNSRTKKYVELRIKRYK